MASWADLPPDLLGRIVDGLDFKCYTRVRGTCPAWRHALVPSVATLLVVSEEEHKLRGPFITTFKGSLFEYREFSYYNSRCVGSSSGWIAISVFREGLIDPTLVLLNPVTAAEDDLPPLIIGTSKVWAISKVVTAPNPTKDNFTAAAICGVDRIAYVTAGARRWATLEPIPLVGSDHLTDLVYRDPGMLYCLTSRGDVYIVRLVEPQAAMIQGPGPSQQEYPVVTVPKHIPVWRFMNYLARISLLEVSDTFQRREAASRGPDLNLPATTEPLLSGSNLPFDQATAFAPPYATISKFISAKYLVFCEGNLYQVWRYTSCSVTLRLPEGGQCRLSENEIFVLRYYPERHQPCWDAVKDLGGYSVFVGRNNAVSIHAGSVPGFRGNCVYWIGGSGRDQGMIFDMETETSSPCRSPSGVSEAGHSCSTMCWYFGSGEGTSSSDDGGKQSTLGIQQ